MDLNDVILKAMGGLGYSLVARSPAVGVFSSAEFSRKGFLDFKTTIHQDDLLLDFRPSRGFSRWRWYDALGLLKKLENQGFEIHWAVEKSPAEVERFLSKNVSLLVDIRDRLSFSYFDGVTYEPKRQ